MQKLRVAVAIVGNERVGKTSMCLRFCKDTFHEDYRPTLGSQLFEKTLVVDGTPCHLVIWDMGGQDQFNKECDMYVKRARVVIVMFSIDDMGSFVQLPRWLERVQSLPGNRAVVLVANKIDLRDGNRSYVDQTQVTSIAVAARVHAMIETSAKTGQNISSVFKTAARSCFPVPS